ncbi:hypothetical protein CEP51_004853 [Fusarium floridanum]|uniref:Uncharacterized protein n=1 Tax=Fusarium floridanum TaxID=1325733 RepID=A0A428RZ86_9HYPO|nr:hypothetical protein CEP51_004853 [Fusarium floridanum]
MKILLFWSLYEPRQVGGRSYKIKWVLLTSNDDGLITQLPQRSWSSVIPTSTIIKNTFPTHHSTISQC